MESYNQLFRYIDSLYGDDEPLSAPLTTSDPIAIVQPRDFVDGGFDDMIEIRTSIHEGSEVLYPKRAVVFNPVNHKIQAWEIETSVDIDCFNSYYSNLIYDQILLYSDRYRVVVPMSIRFIIRDAPLCSVVGTFNGIQVHLGFAHATNSDQLQQQLPRWFVPIQTYLVGVNNIVRVSPRPVTTNHDMHALNGNIVPKNFKQFIEVKPTSSWSNTDIAAGIYEMPTHEFNRYVSSIHKRYISLSKFHPMESCSFVYKPGKTHVTVFLYTKTRHEYDMEYYASHATTEDQTSLAPSVRKEKESDKEKDSLLENTDEELRKQVIHQIQEVVGEKEHVTKATSSEMDAYSLFHDTVPISSCSRPVTPRLTPEFEDVVLCQVPHSNCLCTLCDEAVKRCPCVQCKKLMEVQHPKVVPSSSGGLTFVNPDQVTQTANPTVPEHGHGPALSAPMLVKPSKVNPRGVEHPVSISQLEIEAEIKTKAFQAGGVQSQPVVVAMKPVIENIKLSSVPLEVTSQPTITEPNTIDIQQPTNTDTLSLEGTKLPIIADMGDGVDPDFAASITYSRVFKNFTEIELAWRWYWYPLLMLIPAVMLYVISNNVDDSLFPLILSYFIGGLSITIFVAKSFQNYLATRRKTPSWFTLHKLGPLSTFVGFTKDAKSSDLPHNLYEITSYRQQGQVYRKIVQYVPVCELLVNEIMSQATLFDSYDSINAFVETRIAAVGCRVKNINVPTTAIVNGWGQRLEMTTLQTTKLIVKASLYLTLQTSIEQGFCLGSSD